MKKKWYRLVRSGAHVLCMGDRLQSLYVIRSGTVKTYLTTEDGEEQILGFHRPGDAIGFDAIASGQHVASAVALETSSVCVLRFRDVAKLCQRSPKFSARFLQAIGAEMCRHIDSLLLSKGSADARVATFLLAESASQSERGYSPTTLTPVMTRTDTAKYLGLTVETVSRILTRLQHSGVLTREREQIRIHDLDALRRLAIVPHGGASIERDQRAGIM